MSPNVFTGESFVYELKSPTKIELWYLDDSEYILLERESRYDSILLCLGL